MIRPITKVLLVLASISFATMCVLDNYGPHWSPLIAAGACFLFMILAGRTHRPTGG